MLDAAVEQVTGGRVVWHCESDRWAARVLELRRPGVPNLGDIRRVNWSRVRWGSGPVEVICGGFPCTDVSFAGKQAGIGAHTQSGLWSAFAQCIEVMRPETVVIENVRNLLHVRAARDLEPPDEAVDERGLGAVLGDLADLGYDAQWEVVSAAAAGAPHRRERIFIVAHPGGG